jgi:hypothetical protein
MVQWDNEMRRLVSRYNEEFSYASAALVGLFGFFSFFGASILDPWDLSWVMRGDSGQSQLAWMFFAQSKWSFPLGNISGLPDGISSNLIAADGLALFSIPLKLLLPTAIAVKVQFFGFWLCFCFVMQAVFSLRLLKLFLAPGWIRFLALVLLSFAPVVPFRQAHLALCGQWVLLAILDSLLRSDLSKHALRWKSLVGYTFVALATHAYLGAMALGLIGFWFASYFIWEPKQRWKSLGNVSLYGLFALISLWTLGYFQVSGSGDTEAFFYRADILQFFVSNKLSSFVPSIRTKFHSYDGFSYLGLGPGCLFLYLLWNRKRCLGVLRQRSDWPGIRGVFLACGLLWFYALGPAICLGGNEILWLQWLYRPIWPLVLAFRSTGRFVWPAFYCSLLMVCVLPPLLFSRKKALVLLVAMVSLQVIELGPWWIKNSPGHTRDWNYFAPLSNQFGVEGIRRVALLAPYFPLHGKECSEAPRLEIDWYLAAGAFAAEHAMGINSASLGRTNEAEALRFCRQELRQAKQAVQPHTLYVLHPELDADTLALFGRDADCQELRSIKVCRAKR